MLVTGTNLQGFASSELRTAHDESAAFDTFIGEADFSLLDEIDSGLPEGAYLGDATWADNSPVHTASFSGAQSFQAMQAFDIESYEYIPRAERAELQGQESAFDELFNFEGEEALELYLGFLDEELYGSEIDLLLRGLLLEGCSLGQAVLIYGLSLRLETDIHSLLPEPALVATEIVIPVQATESSLGFSQEIPLNVAQGFPGRISQEISPELTISLSVLSEQNFLLLADDLGVCADVLVEFSIENRLGFLQMEQLTDAAMLTGIVALSGSSGQLLPMQEFDAPYNYDFNTAERINLNTGGLVYETVDYVLPGRNGLDLVIGRRYDSDSANVGNPGTVSAPGVFATTMEDYNHLNRFHGLGHGWSFMFSSIQGNVLHLADGRSLAYRLLDTDYGYIDTFIVAGYSRTELSLRYRYSTERYELKYKDGRTEFFDRSGRLVEIRDRYGNAIHLVHSLASSWVNGEWVQSMNTITITDTLGRVTTIAKNNNGIIVSLPDNISLQYNIVTGTQIQTLGITLTPRYLTSYTDPMGIQTLYTYNINSAFVNAVRKDLTIPNFRAENLFVNLTSISHPTGFTTAFNYETVDKNLGRSGLQRVYRITSRHDVVSGVQTNRKNYTYSANNNSGWPQHQNPADLPNNFTYHTTVTTPISGISEQHTFNNRHLTREIDTKHGSLNVSNKQFGYTDRNPTLITTKSYEHTNNHLFLETIERLEYDNRGNVTASFSPLAGGNANNTEHKTTYTYNAIYNQLTSVSYKQDANTTITINYTLDPTNRHPITETVLVNGVQKARTDWTYDSFGNILTERRYINGDNDTSNSILTTYGYDRGAYLSSVNTGGVTSSYQYDNRGRMTRAVNGRGHATNYAYNDRNDLIRVTHPDNTMRQWARSYTHNYVTFTDERGNQTTTRYNPLGLLTEVRDGNENGTIMSRNVYDSLSRLRTSEDRINNNNTTYTYDQLSRVTDVTARQGLTYYGSIIVNEIYVYSIQNGLFRTLNIIQGDINAPNVITTSYVNNLGQQVQTGAFLDGIEHFDTYSYDYTGNMTEYRSALDRERNLPNPTARWQYDHAGRVVKETNTLNQSVVYAYDALGRNTGITDPAGNTTTFQYDNLGRLTRQSVPFERIGNTTHFAETEYTYDNNSNLTRERVKNNAAGTAATWTRTDYVYNNRNRLTQADSYNGSTVAIRTTYAYDAAGNMTGQTTGGASTAYTYDKYNNVSRITDALGRAETFNYNLAGNLTRKTDRNGVTTSYEYDGLGRLTRTQAGSNTAANVITQSYTRTGQLRNISGNNISITNTYDELGRLIVQNESSSTKVYTYDIGGNRLTFQARINNVTYHATSYIYDNLNRLTDVNENGTRAAAYTYDTNGNRASLTLGNGVITNYSYNPANLVTQVRNHRGGATISQYDYTYFLDGNQRTKTDHTGRTTTYTCDGLGRLTREAESGAANPLTISYTYDNRGNRAGMNNNGVTTAYTYDLSNRLTGTLTNGITTNFTYDGNGNQLSDGAVTYAYDNWGRMTSASTNGVTTTHTYNPDGLRRSKTTNGVTTTHIWDGANIAFDMMGSSVVKYIRGIGLIGSSTDTGAPSSYYLFNANGDVVQLTNTAGVVTKSYDYDAFGNERKPQEPLSLALSDLTRNNGVTFTSADTLKLQGGGFSYACSNYLPTEPNVTYILEFDYQTNGGISYLKAGLISSDGSRWVARTDLIPDGTRRRARIEITMNAVDEWQNAVLQLDVYAIDGGINDVFVSDFKFYEKANHNTEWSMPLSNLTYWTSGANFTPEGTLVLQSSNFSWACTHWLPIKPNVTYVLEFDYKTAGGNSHLQVGLLSSDYSRWQSKNNIDVSGTTQSAYIEITLSEGEEWHNAILQFDVRSANGGVNDVYVSNIRFYEKANPNPWRYGGEYFDSMPVTSGNEWYTFSQFDTYYRNSSFSGKFQVNQQREISIEDLPAGDYVMDLGLEFEGWLFIKQVEIRFYEDDRYAGGWIFNADATEQLEFTLTGGNMLRITVSTWLLGMDSALAAANVHLHNLRTYIPGTEIIEYGTYYLRNRHYQPRTGRFMSEDPFWRMQGIIRHDPQGLNLYAYCVNNPIRWRDPSGLKIEIVGPPNRNDFRNDTTYNRAVADYEKALAEYNRAIEYLKGSEAFRDLYNKLNDAEEVFIINFTTDKNAIYNYGTRTINWNPKLGFTMKDGTSVMSPAMALVHEMGHGAQHLDGGLDAYINARWFWNIDREQMNMENANLRKYETPIARQLGEPTRSKYGDERGSIIMNNSTHYRTTHINIQGRPYTVDHGMFWANTTISAWDGRRGRRVG